MNNHPFDAGLHHVVEERSVAIEIDSPRERSTPRHLSERALEIAAMFDLDLDLNLDADAGASAKPRIIVPACTIPLPPGGIIFITGPSGGGKSTLLGLLAEKLRKRGDVPVHFGFSRKTEISGTIRDRLTSATGAVPAALAGEQVAKEQDRDEHCRDEREPAVIDCFADLPLARALAILSRAGLAEARLMVRGPKLLSDGERFRLQLAHLFAAAERAPTATGAVLLCDEFCSPLDRITARAVACSARRWITSTNHTLVVASAHDDLLDPLQPDVLVATSLNGTIAVHRRNEKEIEADGPADPCHRPGDSGRADEACHGGFAEGVIIEDGSIADYDGLAQFHYRAGRPATIERVFRIVLRAPSVVGRYLARRDESQTIGALVRSHPILSCALRDRALGDRYRGLTQAQRARIINAEFRTISRVVIDPRFRGGGLASRLVRHALERPATACTEALAAMGRVHPFFERAGMTRFEGPERGEDLRLLDALAHAGVGSGLARDLIAPSILAKRIEGLCDSMRAWMLMEIRRWHCAWGGLRRARAGVASTDLLGMLRLARLRIVSRPVYYIAVHEATAPAPFPRRDKPGG